MQKNLSGVGGGGGYVLLTRLNPHPHLVQNLCFPCPQSRVQSRVLIARLLPQLARFLYRCCSILISRHAFLASPLLGGFETKPRKRWKMVELCRR